MRRAILAFYDRQRRALPWRENREPYRVWVSEVMLQQTRVETVLPYYERWLARFPSLEHLARADLDDVLQTWAGLGYYSRARNLHRAAQLVRERHAGTLPGDSAALRALPGFGSYTAGAVASIAYGERTPAIDGNTRRVLTRWLGADPGPAALQRAARSLVPRQRPGDFNQALMDLGATICTPQRPRCTICPTRQLCRAARDGLQSALPPRKTRVALPEFQLLTLVLEHRGRVLLTRTHAGLLAHMWRFPAVPLEGDAIAAAGAVIRSVHDDGGVRLTALGTVSHTFSHRREHYHVVLAEADIDALADEGEWKRVAWHEIESLAMPAAQRRIARLVRAHAAPA